MRKPRDTNSFIESKIVQSIVQTEDDYFASTKHSEINLALIYPNRYEVGSSNLGFHRVLQIARLTDGVHCERFYFHPSFRKFYSFDHLRPLDEFSIWAFAISYEMDYFNVIHLLNKRGIPLLSKLRTEKHPILLAGGMVTFFNSRPLHPIMDIIYHGDAELYFARLLCVLKEQMRHKPSKDELLTEASCVPMVSVPRLGRQAEIYEFSSPLSQGSAHSLFTNSCSSFGKRHLVEMARGCPYSCAFCISGHTRKPVQNVPLEQLLLIIDSLILLSGMSDFGFIAGTPNDYPWIDQFLEEMEKRKVRFSLSSLRLNRLTPSLLRGLIRSGQKSITLAPEGGSQRIRDLFRKGINNDDLDHAFQMIAKSGIHDLKLYGIYGLEEELNEDLDAFGQIAALAQKRGIQKVAWSINPLIPKPKTPFSDRMIQPSKTLRQKQKTIRKSMNSQTKVHFESIQESHIQFKLAQGDESILLDFFHGIIS